MAVLAHRRSGDCDIWLLSAGTVRMDGGAIFGVVPRPLWETRLAPDDRNRVLLGMHCLLVRTGDDLVLIETGFGGKLSDKLREIFALDDSEGLAEAFAELGFDPADVSRVVLTHLHHDHAGGCTVWTGGDFVPAFPNATYYVQRGEWDDALQADGQTVNGYRLKEVVQPLDRTGAVSLLDGPTEICSGIRSIVTPGHTRMHQSVLVETGAETFCFVGDLIPTSHHLRPIYILAYDLYPRQTYLVKQELMARAVAEDWVMVWVHDIAVPWGHLRRNAHGAFVPEAI